MLGWPVEPWTVRFALIGGALLFAHPFARASDDPLPSDDPPPSGERTDDEQAKLLFTNGKTLYGEGNYEAAILAFEEAYALSRKPGLLFNIANAQERLGQLQAALDTLAKYRVYADADQQEALNRRIYNIERRLGVRPPDPAAPDPTAPNPTAPNPTAVAPRSGAVPAPPPAPVPFSTPLPRRGRPGLWTMGAGLVVAGGTGATAIATYATSRRLQEEGGEVNRARFETLRPINNVAVVLAGVGGAVAVAGVSVEIAQASRSRRIAPTSITTAVIEGRASAVPGIVLAWGE